PAEQGRGEVAEALQLPATGRGGSERLAQGGLFPPGDHVPPPDGQQDERGGGKPEKQPERRLSPGGAHREPPDGDREPDQLAGCRDRRPAQPTSSVSSSWKAVSPVASIRRR